MVTLRQAAQAAKGELCQLESIELDKIEVKDKVFNKVEKIDGKEVVKPIAYKVLVIEGKEFAIKERQLNDLKALLEKKPLTKRVRLMRFDDGKIAWIGLD
jgi:hypothetical protein